MKRKQFCCLILILVGVMSLGLAACEKKQSKTPSDPNLIVLDDYEIRYKGAAVMPDVDGQSAVVLTLDFTNNGKEATSYLWAVSEKVFLDGIALDMATVQQGAKTSATVTEAQLTEIMPGKTIEVKSVYHLPDGGKKTLEAEFSQLLGKKRGFSPLIWRMCCRRAAVPFRGFGEKKGKEMTVWEMYRNISARAVVARSTLTARSRR